LGLPAVAHARRRGLRPQKKKKIAESIEKGKRPVFQKLEDDSGGEEDRRLPPKGRDLLLFFKKEPDLPLTIEGKEVVVSSDMDQRKLQGA